MKVLVQRILVALTAGLLLASTVGADSPVPERRLIVSKDVDFYGSDLQALFDTTYTACENLCLQNPQCHAFTFNTRSDSCFPKTDVSERQPYEGAFSAIVVATPAATLDRARARRADLSFLSSRDLENARAQARGLGGLHPGGAWTPKVLLETVQDRIAKNQLGAATHWLGATVAQTDSADQWMEYARLLGRLKGAKSSDTRRYRARALQAATNAYLRSAAGPQQVSALEVLAGALEDVRRGRDMIPALRLAQEIAPRDDLDRALDEAIGKYGFRITEHEVENNRASPRICAEFNEPLVKAGQDYEPFVALPDPTLAIEASGNRICVAGLEHGSRTRVTFRKGLPAASGETLAKDITLTLYVRDRDPEVRFAGRAYVLPRGPDAGLPVETVNLDTLDLTLRRVSDRNILRAIQERFFGRPLSHWQLQQFGTDIAEEIWTGKGKVQNSLNRDMTTRLPMGDVVGDLPPGIYALTAAIPGADPYDEPGATQWFVLTDLGVTTLGGTDGLHVFVRGLGDAAMREGAEVSLVSRANRVLGTARTDAMGHARFAAGLTRGIGGAEPALVTVRDTATADMSFLALTDPAFDLSDRGVEGREPAPAIDVFLATDRGAYRAGEVIHATALARDGTAQAIPGLPVTAILTRPDGVEYSRHLSADDAAGGHVFDLPLGRTVPRGTWRLEIKADPDAPALASTELLVEDFLPERIDFDMVLPDGPISPGDTPPLTFEARYLFGAPAADLPISGRVALRPMRRLDGRPGFLFGRHDARLSPRSTYFADGVRTDAAGRAVLPVDFPDFDEVPDRPLMADFTVTVSEGSGRPVERRLSRALTPAAPMIGIRPMFDGVVPEGVEAGFELIALGPDMAPVPMPVRWTLNRVETRYQWYQLYGNWNWEATTSRTRIAGGEAMLGAAPTPVAAPVDWGRYELVVERADGTYTASSVDFHAGWYAPADASATPDTLELSLDRPGYRTGDTATLRLVPRYAGKALITVMSNRLIAMKAVDVTEGENLIALDVTDEWGAGAYVSAQVVRLMDVAAGRNPARALGLAHAGIDPGDKALSVSIEAPEQADPRGPLEVAVRVAGVGEAPAYVTLAAVDVGILNLTGFESPDPSAHYFGQRRLGVEIRDVYGRLIDGMNGAMGQIRSGGDAGNRMRTESPPPTEELAAFFSGPVAVGADGLARARFDLPEFNGTVRLMAVAWTAGAVGEAEAEVLVRDPVVVTASLPRFLAPGDTSRMLLEIVHADGPAGRMGLDVVAEGVTLQGTIPSGVTLAEKGKQVISVPVAAGGVGDHAIRIALTTPAGRQLSKTLTLPVRANDPDVAATRRFRLGAGDTFTLDANVFAGLQPGTGTATVSGGPLARFDAPGLLTSLDRYPYGCTEQVASRAMPLLYLSGVARAMGMAEERGIDQRVAQAIDRVLARQSSNGAFGMWRVGSGDFWLDAYVSDFLGRARAQGFEVPALAFRNAMVNLRNRVNYAPDFDKGGQDIAYALMVLAREGAAAMGDLRYYADVKGDDFATPLAAAQLGAALAAYGDQTRADAMFARAAALLDKRFAREADRPVWRVDYGTDLRDAAGLLSLAVEAGSNAVDRDLLTRRITAPDRPLSTQEQAWSLLAAHAMVADPAASGLSVNGQPLAGPLVRVVEAGIAEPMAITNTAAQPTDITLTTFGKPEGAVAASGYGMTLSRSLYTLEGAPVEGPVQAGDRMVVVLRVSVAEGGEARLIVDDPLPAGLEIDNPNLLRSGDVRALDWIDPATADHAEFRADRFIAAVDWRSRKSGSLALAYIVRAISPGDYHRPAATVEDMYRPAYRARTASGRLTVTE